jgi:hypothetical protein
MKLKNVANLACIFLVLLAFCQKKEPDASQKTIAQDKAYNECQENMNKVISQISIYKKYKQQEPATLADVEKEYNVKAACPTSGQRYEFKSIVPKPGEEITTENMQAYYDEPAKRTFKITCPYHRVTIYGN